MFTTQPMAPHRDNELVQRSLLGDRYAFEQIIARYQSLICSLAAAQANNEIARQYILPNPFFRSAEFIMRHWLWLNLFWIVPFFGMWRVTRKLARRPEEE